MTKKDYIIIANAIKQADNATIGSFRDNFLVYLLPKLSVDNPKFDEVRFRKFITK